MTKGCRNNRYRALWRLVLILVLVTAFIMTVTSPATALDLNPWDYFQISYDPITLDKNDIHGSETFYATVSGRAVCSQDLPVSPREAIITSRIFARHTATGTTAVLNPSYVVTIEPFPNKKGDTIEMSKSVPLQFPPDAISGDYDVIGELIEAVIITEVLFANVSIPVTSFLPQEESIGTVKYTAPESNPSEEPIHPESPEPSPIPTSPPTSTPSPIVPEPEQVVPWWIQIVFLLAILTTILNVVWFLRHRRK